MILHGDDDEFSKDLSDYQRNKPISQAAYILKILDILEERFAKKMKSTWRDCSAKACDDFIYDWSGRIFLILVLRLQIK